jgi:preprotein translocase subunit YajC
MEVLLALIAVVAAFYFILMRPVIQHQRKRRADISALTVGDEVLTSGGFFATVKSIATTDDGPMIIELEAAPGIVLRATPAAIDSITRPAAAVEGGNEAAGATAERGA